MGNRYVIAGVGPVAFTGEDKIKLRKFDDSGNVIKEYRLGNKIYPFYIDSDVNGNIYVAAYYDSSYDYPIVPYSHQFIKFNHDGYQVQSGINHNGAKIGKFLFDSSGNIILTGEAVNNSGHVYYPNYDYIEGQVRTGYYTTRKFNSSGTELWKIDCRHHADSYTYGTPYTGNSNGAGALGADFVIDSSNNIIMALYNAEFGIKTLRKFSGTDGSVIWEQYYGTPYLGFYDGYFRVLIDNSDNIYAFGKPPVGSPSDWDYVVYKYNSSGVLQGNSGKIYLPYRGKNAITFNGSNWQFVNSAYIVTLETNLTVTLTTKFGSFLYGSPWTQIASFAFDSSGYLYAGFYPESLYVPPSWDSLVKANLTTETIEWGYEDWSPLPKGIDGGYNSCSCLAIVENPALPAIPLQISISQLTVLGDLYTNIPSIPDYFSIEQITPLLDFAGKIAPKSIFRCYLTGGTGTIQLIVSSFTCRKSNLVTSLSVVIESPSLQQITDVQSRTAGQLIIKAGYLLSDNTEQLSDMIITDYANMRYDFGSSNASMSITGNKAYTLNQKTRKINGISYRNSISGKRLIRCAIDFYINEGDIADLGGGETFVVSSIYLNVNTNGSYMEIQE